jgi:hypothetical protein
VGLREKGLSALESLLFAKYQMYRNVYWHHAVRSATGDVQAARRRRRSPPARSTPRGSAAYTDEGLLLALEGDDVPAAVPPCATTCAAAGLYKRALECPAAEFDERFGDWIADDHALTVAVEDALAGELGLEPGELLVDYPAKTQMLGLDLPVLRRGGPVARVTAAGLGGGHQPADAQRAALPVGAVAARVRVQARRGAGGGAARAAPRRAPAPRGGAAGGGRGRDGTARLSRSAVPLPRAAVPPGRRPATRRGHASRAPRESSCRVGMLPCLGPAPHAPEGRAGPRRRGAPACGAGVRGRGRQTMPASGAAGGRRPTPPAVRAPAPPPACGRSRGRRPRPRASPCSSSDSAASSIA